METITVMTKNMRKDIKREGIETLIRFLGEERGEGLIREKEGDSILLKEEEEIDHILLREEGDKGHITLGLFKGIFLKF